MLSKEFVDSVCPPASRGGDCDGFARKIRFAGEAQSASALAVDSAPMNADPRFCSGDFAPAGRVTTFAHMVKRGQLPPGVAEWSPADRAKRAGKPAELAAPVADKPRRGVRFASGFKIFK